MKIRISIIANAALLAVLTLPAAALITGQDVALHPTGTSQVDDQAAVKAAANALAVVNSAAAYGNLTLPTTFEGATVTWSSTNEKLVTATGEVTRPKERDAHVVLRATLKRGAAQATKDIQVRVVKAFVKASYEAYLFAHFLFDEENIHFSLSQGNNALDWTSLNGGKAVFKSSLGTTGLRDPYIVRSPDGDTFYLMATDLRWFKGHKGPDRKRYIQVWESHDLVNWSEQRDVLVAPADVQNTYAPEATWDDSIGAYVVYWTSKIGNSKEFTPMYATTRDFVTFTEAQVWQPGEWRIDSTVQKVGDWYHRFTKSIDKANGNCHDAVHEKSKSLRAPREQWQTVQSCVGARAGLPETEAPLTFKANPGDVNGDYFYLWLERWIPNKSYVALRSKRIDQPQWEVVPVNFPDPRPKHGVILPITAAEAKALAARYPSGN
ncbi:glycoside hydrolase family 43 protein [Massilia varians]|uniref:glycoside hydrolase family 43 protein n=1 Tax=Massilia varians TaxID=457921 RepID=UPI002554775B|nr:glycoside hydrolase family 43 protein [Massilia varians]MDK6076046.1 glycoside hydrolase family 43 protein [Massilia varians]